MDMLAPVQLWHQTSHDRNLAKMKRTSISYMGIGSHRPNFSIRTCLYTVFPSREVLTIDIGFCLKLRIAHISLTLNFCKSNSYLYIWGMPCRENTGGGIILKLLRYFSSSMIAPSGGSREGSRVEMDRSNHRVLFLFQTKLEVLNSLCCQKSD